MKHIDGRLEKNLQTSWSPQNTPIGEVSDGEEIEISIPDSSTLQIQEHSTSKTLHSLDASKYDAAVGPIAVSGARAGDTISVEIRRIKTGDWGWSSISRNFGLLRNRFDDRLILWRINDGYATTTSDFLKGVKIPCRPFLGVTGTLPSHGEFGMIPPRRFGGNMDNRLLRAGSTIYLPCNVERAMVSFADPHAAQGDGEVCGTAIETNAEVVVRIHIIHGEKISFPRARVPGFSEPESIVTSGISPNLRRAAVIAVEEMMDDLERNFSLTDAEAYALCSVAGNLKISEIVDEPNYVVSMTMPRDIFRE